MGEKKENQIEIPRKKNSAFCFQLDLLIVLIRAVAELAFRCWPGEGVINHNTQVRHLTKVLNTLIKQIYIDKRQTEMPKNQYEIESEWR